MRFVLQLFGGFQLSHRGGELIALTERARAVLSYVAVAPSPVPRQLLAELLDDTGTEQEQRSTLRQALYLIRKATAERTAIADTKAGLLLDTELVEADVQLFQSAIKTSDRRSLEAAVDLYRGPFLNGAKVPSAALEDWLQARRAEFLELVLEALLQLSRLDAAAGLNSSALSFARRALELDPLREDAHRQVMLCLAAVGQRTSALRQFGLARQLLADELGVLPEAKTTALHDRIARGEHGGKETTQPIVIDNLSNEENGRTGLPSLIAKLGTFQRSVLALTFTLAILASGLIAWYSPHDESPNNIPALAIAPFSGENVDSSAQLSMAEELVALLSTHPSIRVVLPSGGAVLPSGGVFRVGTNLQAKYQRPQARYVLEGSVQQSTNRIQVTVRLIDADTADYLWADLLQEEGIDAAALRQQVAYRVYESLIGFTGEIERNEQRLAWLKPARQLDEYDYVRRGDQLAFQFTKEAHERAFAIWREGLVRFPDSAMIRISLAALHRYTAEVGWTAHPSQELDTAWRLGSEASLAPQTSRYEQWLSHWIMAKLAQWCKADFQRSISEARSAIKLVPNDATSRADLAELMANAGKTDLAIEWLQESLRRDPKGPEWYRGNLAWAYYLAGRDRDALAELEKLNKPRPQLLAAIYIKLGRVEQARALMADYVKKNPRDSIASAARWPLIDAFKRRWLDDLRLAGLPEK